jgi:hypothetical protein
MLQHRLVHRLSSQFSLGSGSGNALASAEGLGSDEAGLILPIVSLALVPVRVPEDRYKGGTKAPHSTKASGFALVAPLPSYPLTLDAGRGTLDSVPFSFCKIVRIGTARGPRQVVTSSGRTDRIVPTGGQDGISS